MDPERVREAGEAGDPVVFGDAGKKEVLVAGGLMRAKVVVVTFADTHAACAFCIPCSRPGLICR
jgi:CPA2 family monovalent cation:H+ antiporter-2